MMREDKKRKPERLGNTSRLHVIWLRILSSLWGTQGVIGTGYEQLIEKASTTCQELFESGVSSQLKKLKTLFDYTIGITTVACLCRGLEARSKDIVNAPTDFVAKEMSFECQLRVL